MFPQKVLPLPQNKETVERFMGNIDSTYTGKDMESKALGSDLTSKADFNPISKGEGPTITSSYREAMPTSVYRDGLNPIMSVAERNAMMFPDDMTMEEIVAECKAVRQELFEQGSLGRHA